MYRGALADAAKARGWPVREFEGKTVFAEAAEALGPDEDISVWLERIGEAIGPPWRKDHKLATAAALVAAKAATG